MKKTNTARKKTPFLDGGLGKLSPERRAKRIIGLKKKCEVI